MGGEVLETYADKMIAKGIEQGMIQGIEQGMAQGSIQTTIKMAREFGVPDDKLIERLMNEFSMDREEAEKACREIWLSLKAEKQVRKELILSSRAPLQLKV